MPSDLVLFGTIIGGGIAACFFAAFMSSEDPTFLGWFLRLFRADAKAEKQARESKRGAQFQDFLREKQKFNRAMDGAAEPKKDR